MQNYHYSQKCTTSMVNYGVWEHDEFRGAVMFSQGAAPCIASPFGLKGVQVRELIRVALDNPISPVSKILAASLRLLRKDLPLTKLIVSFADSMQGHVGTIYQASNWYYVGESVQSYLRINGQLTHPKSLHTKYGIGGQSIPWLRDNVDPEAERIYLPPKHKYVYALDETLKPMLEQMRKPYPKASEA